jgi:SAM-dependent methyltransferase
MSKLQQPDYGIDAPGVRRGMFALGAAGLVIAATGSAVSALTGGILATLAGWTGVLGVVVAAYGLAMGSYMTWSSRVRKRRTREHLLDLAGELRPGGHWRGDERVLDVGCGRGLMLVGAARRLTTGTAVGVDLWRSEDQADNTPDAAIENARREGVAERVRVETGDARNLPFDDGSFDVVLSHWVVHNLPDAADRSRALDEMLRVLRPDGVLVLADIANLADYRAHLSARGIGDIRVLDGGWEARVMGVLSGGSYRPQALAIKV